MLNKQHAFSFSLCNRPGMNAVYKIKVWTRDTAQKMDTRLCETRLRTGGELQLTTSTTALLMLIVFQIAVRKSVGRYRSAEDSISTVTVEGTPQ